jgi:ubiquinone/menaquinone biosynthesis C-methylase UbiE
MIPEHSQYKRVAKMWESRLQGESEVLPHEKQFFPHLAKIAADSARILEIGIGTARMVKALKATGCNSKFFGIDIWNPKHCDQVCVRVIGDARSLPFKNEAFDFVYSLGVLEHFPETEKAIFELSRVLKTSGYALVTVPRISIYSPLRWIAYFIKERKKGSFEEVAGRRLTIRTMKKYYNSAGFDVVEAKASGFYVPKVHKFWQKYISGLIPEQIFGAYLFCIGSKRKAEDVN